MARTLQALRRDDEPGRLKVAAPPVVAAAASALGEEEIPFIEVGGKNMPMEASASVLACVPQPAPKLQLHRPEPVEPAVIDEVKKPPVVPVPAPVITFKPLSDELGTLTPANERLAPELLAFHQPDHAVSKQYEK